MQPDLTTLFQAIQALGVVGILGWLVLQFRSGEILPRRVVDELIEGYNEQARRTFEEISKKLDKIIVVCPFGHDSAEIRRSLIKALEEANNK